MPIPRKSEKEKEFIARCVPIVVEEGKEQEQAVAICYSLWRNRHKKKASMMKKAVAA